MCLLFVVSDAFPDSSRLWYWTWSFSSCNDADQQGAGTDTSSDDGFWLLIAYGDNVRSSFWFVWFDSFPVVPIVSMFLDIEVLFPRCFEVFDKGHGIDWIRFRGLDDVDYFLSLFLVFPTLFRSLYLVRCSRVSLSITRLISFYSRGKGAFVTNDGLLVWLNVLYEYV